MEKWIGVVTNPLGLAGFALFLAFSSFGVRAARANAGRMPMQAWGLFGLAAAALAGGLYLARKPEATVVIEVDSVSQKASQVGDMTGIRVNPASSPTTIKVNELRQDVGGASSVIGIDATPPSPASRAASR